MKWEKTKIKKIPVKQVVEKHYSKIDKNTLKETKSIRQETYIYKLYKLNNLGNFFYCTPNPINFLMQHIRLKIDATTKLKDKLKLSTEKFENEKPKTIRKQEKIIDELLVNAISIPIIIYCVLETIVNRVIFENNIFIKCCHYEVQRHVPLEKKLFKIIPNIIFRPNYFDKFKPTFKKIKEIRDNIIHQKSKSKESLETQNLVIELIETDWDSIFKYIQKIERDLSRDINYNTEEIEFKNLNNKK